MLHAQVGPQPDKCTLDDISNLTKKSKQLIENKLTVERDNRGGGVRNSYGTFIGKRDSVLAASVFGSLAAIQTPETHRDLKAQHIAPGLGQHRRRWSNIEPVLGQGLAFLGQLLL